MWGRGGPVVDRVFEHYIRKAKECLEVAERLSMREERERALAMAEQWLVLAREAIAKGS